MQLKKFANISGSLAKATCALLACDAIGTEQTWQFDTALLYYDESDGRVNAIEGVVSATKEVDVDKTLSVKFTLDTLTGASPTGALPQDTVQTFTRPSGKSRYRIGAGQTVLDDTFKDTRLQINSQWQQALTQRNTISAGMHFSKEYDYESWGLNAAFARDFDRKNTTLSAALSLSGDTIMPEGGKPKALHSIYQLPDEQQLTDDYSAFKATRSSDVGRKNTIDALFGLTQVIHRQMLVQLNYSISHSEGYHTDPFKVLSRVDAQGKTLALVYEGRPSYRTKHILFAQTKYHFEPVIVDISYRYLHDDWQINSHTLDTKLRFELASDWFIEPHVRVYHQQAAYFYRPFLAIDAPLPEHASADHRLGAFNAYTIGVKIGLPLSSQDERMSVRLEYYRQAPETDQFALPGQLNGYQIYPKLKAVILQLGYRF